LAVLVGVDFLDFCSWPTLSCRREFRRARGRPWASPAQLRAGVPASAMYYLLAQHAVVSFVELVGVLFQMAWFEKSLSVRHAPGWRGAPQSAGVRTAIPPARQRFVACTIRRRRHLPSTAPFGFRGGRPEPIGWPAGIVRTVELGRSPPRARHAQTKLLDSWRVR